MWLAKPKIRRRFGIFYIIFGFVVIIVNAWVISDGFDFIKLLNLLAGVIFVTLGVYFATGRSVEE